jgi:DNA-binding GntR family transcriptional regulator
VLKYYNTKKILHTPEFNVIEYRRGDKMEGQGILNLTSLKDQVYEYLRYQMRIGDIKPGSVIDMTATSKKLGISRTPLRDALIQLEMEGFVKILPRRGVVVNWLTVQDIKDIYEILGALESMAIVSVSDKFGKLEAKKMQQLNKAMKKAIDGDDFNQFYEGNLEFHNVYIDLSGNKALKKMIDVLKKRLYDFPRRSGYIKEWEVASIKEHQKLVELLSEGKFMDAAVYIRDVHWSFQVQEKYVRKYYSDEIEVNKIG